MPRYIVVWALSLEKYRDIPHLTLLVVEQWPDELGWGGLEGGVVAQVDKPGFPNIIYHQEDIPFVPLAGSCHPKSFHSLLTKKLVTIITSSKMQTRFGFEFLEFLSPNLVKNCEEGVLVAFLQFKSTLVDLFTVSARI